MLCLLLSSALNLRIDAAIEPVCQRKPLSVVLETPTNTSNSYAIVGGHIALALERRQDVDLYLLKLPNFDDTWPSHHGKDLWGEEDGKVLDHSIKRAFHGDESSGTPDLTIRVTIDFSPPAFPSPMIILATTERGYLSNEAVSGEVPLEKVDWSSMRLAAPSCWAADGLVASGAKDVTIIPHGVSSHFRPLDFDTRTSLRASLDLVSSFVFLHVSSLTKNKNPALLLSSFKTLTDRFGNTIKLIIKGNDELYASEAR